MCLALRSLPAAPMNASIEHDCWSRFTRKWRRSNAKTGDCIMKPVCACSAFGQHYYAAPSSANGPLPRRYSPTWERASSMCRCLGETAGASLADSSWRAVMARGRFAQTQRCRWRSTRTPAECRLQSVATDSRLAINNALSCRRFCTNCKSPWTRNRNGVRVWEDAIDASASGIALRYLLRISENATLLVRDSLGSLASVWVVVAIDDLALDLAPGGGAPAFAAGSRRMASARGFALGKQIGRGQSQHGNCDHKDD